MEYTIAEAVEIAEQTGLADRIRLNETIEDRLWPEAPYSPTWLKYRVEKLEAGRTADLDYIGEKHQIIYDLRHRLHASEQTILNLQERLASLERWAGAWKRAAKFEREQAQGLSRLLNDQGKDYWEVVPDLMYQIKQLEERNEPTE